MGKRTPKKGVCRAKVRPRTQAEIAAMLMGAIQPGILVVAALLVREEEPSDDKWIPHTRSPLGARSTCELARKGAFPGARKILKKWLIPCSELDAFIEREGTTSTANDNADEGADPAVQSLAGELGYTLEPSASKRGKNP